MKKLFTFLLAGVFCLFLQAQSNFTITSSCDNITICNTSSDCSNMFAELVVAATTDCSTSSDLTYTYQIDLFDDGSNDFSDALASASEDFPMGTHRIIFTILDQCNTSEMCDYLFEVKDCSEPTPICIFGIATTVMPQSGSINISAINFESGSSYDNCSDYSELHFSFSQDINNTILTIECANVPDDGLYPLTLYVTDDAGNFDFCSTYVNIQDPFNVCGNLPTSGMVSTVTTDGCDLEGVEYDINGNLIQNGSFSISNLDAGDVVTPSIPDNNYLNGVTTYDLVLIDFHILNIQQLDEPWKLIAADVNENGAITTLDKVLLRALILYNITSLPNGKSWVVNPSTYTHDGIMTEFSFLGIKLGDVNSTVFVPNCLQGSTVDSRTLGSLNIFAKNQTFKKGETITINTFAENYEKIIGGQFTLDFDASALEFQSIEGNESIDLENENFGLSMVDEGLILCSWNTSTSQNLDSNDAFYNITFTAKKDGKLSDFLTINSKKLNNEIYIKNENDFEFWNVELNLKNEQVKDVLSISPNPFSEKTTFNFSLEKEGKVELEFFDTNGRLIFSQQKNMQIGENQIEIQKSNLPNNGIYFYKIKTDNNVNSGKIISQ